MSSALCGPSPSSPNVSREDLDQVFACWPDNFGSLFEMGLKSFERLFNHRPQLMNLFNFPDPNNWKKDDKIKKIVLTLEQTLVEAVATFADPHPDPETTRDKFAEHMEEIGGLHRGILPHVNPENFELLFKLVPEVIVEVVSARSPTGPLAAADRQRLLASWQQLCLFMSRHVVSGWERRVVPRTPKFHKAYRFERSEEGQSGAAASPAHCNAHPAPGSRPTQRLKRGGSGAAVDGSPSDRADRRSKEDEIVDGVKAIVLHDVQVVISDIHAKS